MYFWRLNKKTKYIFRCLCPFQVSGERRPSVPRPSWECWPPRWALSLNLSGITSRRRQCVGCHRRQTTPSTGQYNHAINRSVQLRHQQVSTTTPLTGQYNYAINKSVQPRHQQVSTTTPSTGQYNHAINRSVQPRHQQVSTTTPSTG